MHSALLASVLIAGVSAAPSSRLQTRGVGTTFALITTVTNAPDPVGELNRGIWAVGASSNGLAILVDRSDQALLYEYRLATGSTGIATASTGIVITSGGTATVPSANEVQLVSEDANSGVQIGQNDQGIPVLQFDGGAFMACKASFLNPASPNPNEIVLSFKEAGQRTFAACADVTLISNCAGSGTGSSNVGALGNPINVSCQPN